MMLVLPVCRAAAAVLLCGVLWAHGKSYDNYHATLAPLVPLDQLSDVPGEEGAYFEPNSHSRSKDSKAYDRENEESSLSLSTSSEDTSSGDASSVSTKEQTLVERKYRVCTPCPSDMVLGYTAKNIHWICGKYQRARRSFKSTCMLRYRNCEDGTLFVKIGDGKCKEDPYNGRHWFYVYKT